MAFVWKNRATSVGGLRCRIAVMAATFAASIYGMPAFAATAAPNVVVSIKPIHSLVAGVMADVSEPQLLLKANASPHSYALRPSEAEMLTKADIVIRIGPYFEAFLDRPLETLGTKARVINLADAASLNLLEAREGGVWEAHDHGHEHDDHGQKNEADHETDGHIWLDPSNAKAMVYAIAENLADADKVNADQYRKNAAGIADRIDLMDGQIKQELEPVKNKPFIVFHDAYQYFQTHFGVNIAGSITVTPDREPGAKRVIEIKDKIKQLDSTCVFAEPQFEPRLIKTLIADTGAKTGTLDPEGGSLEPGPELYFSLMQNLARSMVGCLSE